MLLPGEKLYIPFSCTPLWSCTFTLGVGEDCFTNNQHFSPFNCPNRPEKKCKRKLEMSPEALKLLCLYVAAVYVQQYKNWSGISGGGSICLCKAGGRK